MKRFEEMERAALPYGSDCLYMHMSALSPATRKSHADRHGRLYTAAQVREFWADPANVDGCKCTLVPVLIGEDGKPLVPAIVKRARRNYQVMAAEGPQWAK